MSESARISLASSRDPKIHELLSRHPRVDSVAVGQFDDIHFQQGDWARQVSIGDPTCEQYGLVEVMDNNPLVCADHVSVPGPSPTLALIALAPLVEAGLLAESPVVVLNFGGFAGEIDYALERLGWRFGATTHHESLDLGSVLAATVMASIRTPEDLDDIDALYDERFGRSFYVRRDETSDWGPEHVAGKPHALYRLRISPDQPNSLLTIRVMADRDGKCGAAQVVHAMNVMCGFEESLGIS